MLEFAVSLDPSIRFYGEIRSFILFFLIREKLNKQWTWILKVKLILENIITDGLLFCGNVKLLRICKLKKNIIEGDRMAA